MASPHPCSGCGECRFRSVGLARPEQEFDAAVAAGDGIFGGIRDHPVAATGHLPHGSTSWSFDYPLSYLRP
jgi:hypothetical protein